MNPLTSEAEKLIEYIDSKLRQGLRALAGTLIVGGSLLYLQAAKVFF